MSGNCWSRSDRPLCDARLQVRCVRRRTQEEHLRKLSITTCSLPHWKAHWTAKLFSNSNKNNRKSNKKWNKKSRWNTHCTSPDNGTRDGFSSSMRSTTMWFTQSIHWVLQREKKIQ
eukprot:PhF_6_TR25493/c0_g1_i1/m.35478